MAAIQAISRDGQPKGKIESFEDPRLYEEINGPYTFSFRTFPESFNLLNPSTLFIVDGQRFEIARMSKTRNETASAEVECEHISYSLLHVAVMFDEMEAPPLDILSVLLAPHPAFSVGVVEFDEPVIYKPSEDYVKGALYELAKGIGGELVFDNYTVSIVRERGSNKGLAFNLGENIRSLTEEVDYRRVNPWSYEIDVVDLAHLPELQAGFTSAGLGDTVRVSDPELDVSTSQRIVSYDRDPFSKALPKLQIGQVIPDFFNYQEDQDDEDDPEEVTHSLRAEFVGVATVDVVLSGGDDEEDEDEDEEGYKGHFIEFGTAPLSADSHFSFSKSEGYDEMLSCTVGLQGENGISRAVPVIIKEVKAGGKITGVRALGNWGTGAAPPLKVSIMAVCRTAPED